jgi:hypothetical protein
MPERTGMTTKQYARERFFRLCEQYKEAQQHLDTEEGRKRFIVLSIQVHIAKADVPKSLWRYARLGQ